MSFNYNENRGDGETGWIWNLFWHQTQEDSVYMENEGR